MFSKLRFQYKYFHFFYFCLISTLVTNQKTAIQSLERATSSKSQTPMIRNRFPRGELFISYHPLAEFFGKYDKSLIKHFSGMVNTSDTKLENKKFDNRAVLCTNHAQPAGKINFCFYLKNFLISMIHLKHSLTVCY